MLSSLTQGLGEVDQRVERGLRGAGLVALNLIDMQAGEVGKTLLGEAAGFAELRQAGGEVRKRPVSAV